MIKIILPIVLLLTISSSCQVVKPISYKNIEPDLIAFLNNQGDIRSAELDKFKEGKFGLFFSGVYNGNHRGDLIDGLYTFSAMKTNTHVYFLLVEGSQMTILNISTKDGLSDSILKVLDFADRKRYCSTITGELISEMIETYYKRNRDTNAASDVNCEKGIKDIKSLP